MLRLRFRKVGKKNQPSYRLVVCKQRSKPQGKYLENLGFYNPRTKEAKLSKERILYWLKNGAQASATVHNLLVRQGLIKAKKVKAWHGHRESKDKAVIAEKQGAQPLNNQAQDQITTAAKAV